MVSSLLCVPNKQNKDKIKRFIEFVSSMKLNNQGRNEIMEICTRVLI